MIRDNWTMNRSLTRNSTRISNSSCFWNQHIYNRPGMSHSNYEICDPYETNLIYMQLWQMGCKSDKGFSKAGAFYEVSRWTIFTC